MENKPRPCGCKGCRTCLVCERDYGIQSKYSDFIVKENGPSYVYCHLCNKAWSGWDMNVYKDHPNHEGDSIPYPGVFIQLDFLSEQEETDLIKDLDEMAWDISQSGRRKQNFGPKTNFKKRKIKAGDFNGFPEFTKFIQERFNSVPLLENYETIEQCSLEYDPDRGASIDPHIDDCWIWGERIVTVNCLTDSVLTMTPYGGDWKRYNLDDATKYPPVVNANDEVSKFPLGTNINNNLSSGIQLPAVIVRIPMPRRSLLILYGQSRYLWEHSVLREDITKRRVCIAYREFTPPYLRGGIHEEIGDVIRCKSQIFWPYKKN